MVYLLIVSYVGTAYAGWQRQDNALTVQQVVEEALAALLGRPVRVAAASRTDAGVHARGQAVQLSLPEPFPERGLVHGTNHHLPYDVRILAACRMRPGFDARRHATGKRYVYRMAQVPVLSPLDAPYMIRVPLKLDLEAMRRAAALLPGRHDFSAFAVAGGAHTSPVRRLTAAALEGVAPYLAFRVEGEGFLRGMVRGLAGTLLEVGRGRRSVESFARLLEGGDRAAAGPTAPAHGLELARVWYPEECYAFSWHSF